jgi:hypothetical protein
MPSARMGKNGKISGKIRIVLLTTLNSHIYVLDSLRTKLPKKVLEDIKTFLHLEAKHRYDLDLDKDFFEEYLAHVCKDILWKLTLTDLIY